MKYHYVYRITNKENNKHYYGARTSDVVPELDLGIKYFSSSKDKEFMNDQKLNKYKFKYKIIKILETREDAINLEINLHNKFEVGKNKNFYNRSKQSSTKFDTSGISFNSGIPKTKECKEKLSKLYKGKTLAELYGEEKAREIKLKISKSLTGISRITPEGRKKLSELKKGKPIFSEEDKALMSENRKNKIHVKKVGASKKYRTDDVKEFKENPLLVGSTLKFGCEIILKDVKIIIFKYEFVKLFSNELKINCGTIRNLLNSTKPYKFTGVSIRNEDCIHYRNIDGMIVNKIVLEEVGEEYLKNNREYIYNPYNYTFTS